MVIKRFKAENFRNIENCDIEFSPGVNILYGKNAQGKTNVVEGIYLFSRGRSFRTSEDRELVKFGKEGFRISIEYEGKDTEGILEYALFGRERRRIKNGYKVSKITELLGSFRSVLFYPDDLSLVKDGPEERRGFLNIAASQCYPAYMKIYGEYKNVLDQRNALLKLIQKGGVISDDELLSWSETMADHAAEIYVLRRDYIGRLKGHLKDSMLKISEGKEELTVKYKSNIDEGKESLDISHIKSEYKRIFKENIEREKCAGVTLYGPHRDDIEFLINGKSARLYASQGQQRSVVLALKLAEGEVNHEIWGDYPVYLFDDVLSELDEKRREFVTKGVKDKQIIITTCEREKADFEDAKVIEVLGGSYVSSYR